MKQRNKESTSRNWQVKSLGVATLLTFIFSLSTVSAQESLNVAGGDASGSGGSVSYSIGQVAYQTHTGTSGSVAEGLQQPFEISVVTAIEEAQGINLTVTAYPNPTTHYLILSIDEFELSNISYQLYDMNGKLLQSEKITDNRTSIFMSNLVPATYFVKVILGNKEIKTFKIIKTQ
jgi:hypothetical protein